MKRVVLASFDRVPSAKGAARHILQNHAALTEGGYAVSLVTLGDRPLEGLRHLPVATSERNLLLRGVAFHRAVREVFGRNEFDVYHVRAPWEGLAAPTDRGAIIYEVNGLLSIECAHHFPGVLAQPHLRRKLEIMELALLERAALVITPSAVTREHLVALGVEAGRVVVIPNAPVVEPLPSRSARRPGPLRLCYVGTLASWQGLGRVLSALGELELPFELSVRTPSGKDARRALARGARRAGIAEHVRVLEPLEPAELGAWLAQQDVALAPLEACERNLVQGGMPLKLLDAMAARLPVVAPEMPIVSEVLGPAYPTYRRHSMSSFLELISAFARDERLRDRAVELGASRIATLFHPQLQRDRLIAAYRALDSRASSSS